MPYFLQYSLAQFVPDALPARRNVRGDLWKCLEGQRKVLILHQPFCLTAARWQDQIIASELVVVLVSPRNPLNMGATARAMANFGLDDLRVVNPYEIAFREAVSAVGG